MNSNNITFDNAGKIIFLIFIILFGFQYTPYSQAQIITVKQDGTGDYTIIQDAVDNSVNGDTVLVYQGIYYENIDMTGKGIVLAGTWLLFQADSLIDQTIIDGNQSGTCIMSLSGDTLTQIIGFTLQNGVGAYTVLYSRYGDGGGIWIKSSKFKICHCKVIHNFGNEGGGIFAWRSFLELSGNTIANNWAVGNGGGIRTGRSNIIYDSIHLNNIYLNYSPSCSDIAVLYSDTISKIWLDTCTVFNPDKYYVGKLGDWQYHIDRPPISVLHGKIEQVNFDLFIDPNGNDNNSGLTPDDPLKTISFALLKIRSDSIEMKTIHVTDGIYSASLTGEHTPLQLKNYVNLVGQSRDNTIIDGENKYECARFAFGQDYTYLKNLSFINGNGYPIMWDGGLSTGYSKKLILDSIAFINITGDYISAIYSDSDDTLIIKNSVFQNCQGYKTIILHVKFYESPRYNEFVSCRFSDNHPDTSWYKLQNALGLQGSVYAPDWNKTIVTNCLFNDNTDSVYSTTIPSTVAIHTLNGCDVEIVNSTFSNNRTINNSAGGAITATFGSDITFYNCILYNNYGYQAILVDNLEEDANSMSVNYTLVQDGQAGIRDYGSFNHLTWGEGNLDDDPLFYGSEEYPYAIDFGSPCIDAGTLELPPGIELPEYDLAGNPRVWGESVDMGAYEYGPWVGVKEVGGRQSAVGSQMNVNPNPFKYGTYVSYALQSSGKLNISVYGLTGMKVRTLENHQASKGDSGKFYWDGSDDAGNKLPSGVYLIRLTMNGKEVETVKAVRD